MMAKKREHIKIFFIEKKWWTAAACLCLAAAMFYVVNYPAAVGASASAAFLNGISPITILTAAVFLREPVSPFQLICMAAILLGVALNAANRNLLPMK